MAKRENWVKLEIAPFCIEVFRHADNLAEWTKSLAESLAYGDPSKNEFGARLLGEADAFREERSKAASKRWEKQHMQNDAKHMQNDAKHMQNDAKHMQNDAKHMQNDAITSFDVMSCSVMSSSMDLGFKEEEKESKEQFTREEENGNKFDKQSREFGAGANHDQGRFASGESQGGQHGTGVEGVAGEGEASAENHCAEGEEDRRVFPDDQEQKCNVQGGGRGTCSELARLQADQHKIAIQADTGETLHASGLPDSVETCLAGHFCPAPHESATGIEKSPRTRASGQKKAIALGKSALEMEYPDAWALWEAAPKVARVRSSTMQVLQAWAKARKAGMPPIDEIMASMDAWKGSKKWAEHGGEYIEGLHRWIANRQWENTPASSMQIATEQAREVDRMITEELNSGY